MTQNAVTNVSQNAVATVSEAVLLDYLKGIGTNLPEPLAKQFLHTAQAFELNPFKREIYAIPYTKKMKDARGNWVEQVQLSIVVGYETYIRRAERSGLLQGWSVTTVGNLDFKMVDEQYFEKTRKVKKCVGGQLKAIVTIHRKDWDEPFTWEVDFEEYDQHNSMWADKPKTMLKKVAITQAFRMCFSEQTNGLPYTSDELPDHMGALPTETVVDGEKTPPPVAAHEKPAKASKKAEAPKVVEAEIVAPAQPEPPAVPQSEAKPDEVWPKQKNAEPEPPALEMTNEAPLDHAQILREMLIPVRAMPQLVAAIREFQGKTGVLTNDVPKLKDICLVKKSMIEQNNHFSVVGPDGMTYNEELRTLELD